MLCQSARILLVEVLRRDLQVAAEVTQERNDKKQFVPMLEQVKALIGASRSRRWRMRDISARKVSRAAGWKELIYS
ncbi:MAG: hypothetical protein EPN47_17945 [Acidobacteria bacterium]|nr:MAG: hypothetical protein EPN47_17945 [Acidobacteriota bacterium]